MSRPTTDTPFFGFFKGMMVLCFKSSKHWFTIPFFKLKFGKKNIPMAYQLHVMLNHFISRNTIVSSYLHVALLYCWVSSYLHFSLKLTCDQAIFLFWKKNNNNQKKTSPDRRLVLNHSTLHWTICVCLKPFVSRLNHSTLHWTICVWLNPFINVCVNSCFTQTITTGQPTLRYQVRSLNKPIIVLATRPLAFCFVCAIRYDCIFGDNGRPYESRGLDFSRLWKQTA